MLILAVGSNSRGPWGSPAETMFRLPGELAKQGITVVCTSSVYTTAPVGLPMQPDVLNGVIIARSERGTAALLTTLHRIERNAGRSRVVLSRTRCLDLDLVARGGKVVGRPLKSLGASHRPQGRLLLPHPMVHRRAFVLRPLAEVAPAWVHPLLRRTARELLRRIPRF